MTLEEWALIASVVFTGLFSGLYSMLNLIFHQVMGAMDGPEFARFLRRFLTVARRSPFNYVVLWCNRCFRATPGGDYAIGWGSPDVERLAEAVVRELRRSDR